MSDDGTFSVNGLKISWRDVIQVGVTIVALAGLHFAATGRIDANERSIVDLYRQTDLGRDQRERMDRDGTRRSHEIDAMQQQLLESHTQQLSELNKKISDILPKVDKIDANVLWLMGKQLEASKR